MNASDKAMREWACGLARAFLKQLDTPENRQAMATAAQGYFGTGVTWADEPGVKIRAMRVYITLCVR